MTRLIALALFSCVACSSSQLQRDRFQTIDPVNEPRIARATDDERARKAAEGAVQGAETGRRVGRVAGAIAAVFGGPESETLDATVDRYRRTRDAVTVVGALIGATKGAMEGEKEEILETDAQYAELLKIEGLVTTRPSSDQIDVRLPASPDPHLLEAIAAVFVGLDDRTFDIEGPDDTSLSVRESLIDLGVSYFCISAHRSDSLDEVVIHIRRRA